MKKAIPTTAAIATTGALALVSYASQLAHANQERPQDILAPKSSVTARPAHAIASHAASAPKLPSVPALTADQVFLIRSTLSALNDANQTGNYTVLRDTAAPSFAQRYTATDLAVAFTNLRNNPRFAEACAGTPSLMEPAQSTPEGTVLYRGLIGPKTAQLQFSIQYQRIANRYRLSALAVTLPDLAAARPAPAPAPRPAQQSPPR